MLFIYLYLCIYLYLPFNGEEYLNRCEPVQLRLFNHFPIDLEANGHCPFAVPNQSVHGKYNLILVLLNKRS